MEDIKVIIASNLAALRKKANLTQLELAEKLNYSDKAVSKWERAEAIPDIVVLKQLADMYGTTVDSLMSPGKAEEIVIKPKLWHNKKFILSLLSFFLTWFVATCVFVLMELFAPKIDRSWLTFVIAFPTSAIVVVVFSALWANNLVRASAVSALLWSMALCIYIILNPYVERMWLVFIAGIPFQVLIALWFYFKRTK